MYLGNTPALSYTSFAKQDFTTSATTSYTLDNPVTNANELALFINFVRQEPTTAYSASGTTLTLTSATSATDDMYCVYLGKAVQTVNPPNASVGLSQLTATGTKDATTFLRGDNSFIGVPIKKITVNDNITTQYSGLGGTVTNTLTDFNVTHTALSTSNKLAFFISIPYYLTLGDYIGITRFKLNNGTSNVTPSLFYDYIGTQGNKEMSINASYFDLTPASTNAITYTIQIEIYRPQGTSTITIGQSDNPTRLMCVEY